MCPDLLCCCGCCSCCCCFLADKLEELHQQILEEERKGKDGVITELAAYTEVRVIICLTWAGLRDIHVGWALME